MDLTLTLNHSDFHLISELPEFKELNAEEINSKGFDGASQLSLLISISAVSVTYLGKIIIELIKNKRIIEVIHEGTTMKGLSEENTMAMLNKLIDTKTKELSQNSEKEK